MADITCANTKSMDKFRIVSIVLLIVPDYAIQYAIRMIILQSKDKSLKSDFLWIYIHLIVAASVFWVI